MKRQPKTLNLFAFASMSKQWRHSLGQLFKKSKFDQIEEHLNKTWPSLSPSKATVDIASQFWAIFLSRLLVKVKLKA